MKTIKAILLCSCLLFAGCFPEDIPVKPYDRGNSQENQVGITKNYAVQVFFDLGSNSATGSNNFSAWDLAFAGGENAFDIRLNTARLASAAVVTGKTFAEVTAKDESMIFRYEHQNGLLDSSGIGKWWKGNGPAVTPGNNVYIIDRGNDEKGKSGGFRKLKINYADGKEYSVTFADLDGKNEQTVIIPKDPALNYVCFTFADGGKIMPVEPPKDDWDILFTRYTQYFNVEGYDVYSVVGVLLNPYNTAVAEDSLTAFEDISNADIPSYDMQPVRDGIGYDWKTVDIQAVYYTVNPKKIYIIRDSEGFYYKLRFTDYYMNVNNKLEKGYPKFEFQKL